MLHVRGVRIEGAVGLVVFRALRIVDRPVGAAVPVYVGNRFEHDPPWAEPGMHERPVKAVVSFIGTEFGITGDFREDVGDVRVPVGAHAGVSSEIQHRSGRFREKSRGVVGWSGGRLVNGHPVPTARKALMP